MLFVSGTENGDARHAQTLVDLALAQGAMFSPSRGEAAGGGGGGSGPQPSSPGCPSTSSPAANPASASISSRFGRLPDGRPLRLQMGLHCGEVGAGVVGSDGLRYGCYGPAVAVARALERSSAPGVLRASEAAVERLRQQQQQQMVCSGAAAAAAREPLCWVPGGTITLGATTAAAETLARHRHHLLLRLPRPPRPPSSSLPRSFSARELRSSLLRTSGWLLRPSPTPRRTRTHRRSGGGCEGGPEAEGAEVAA